MSSSDHRRDSRTPRVPKVVVQLDRDLAIALFEWSYQFMTHHDPTFQHPADVIGIDQLSGELERALTEPFDERYPELLRDARRSAVERYRAHMGEVRSTWLDGLQYRTSDDAQG